jgi:hypothetical protein
MQLEQPPDDKNIPANFDDEYDLSKLKRRMKGICVSFGEFLIRKIIPIRGFNVASCVLLGEKQPQDHFVEGLCQILTTAGKKKKYFNYYFNKRKRFFLQVLI